MNSVEEVLLGLAGLNKRSGDHRFFFTPSGYVGLGSCVVRLPRKDRRNLSAKKIGKLFPFIASSGQSVIEVQREHDVGRHLEGVADDADECSVFPLTFTKRAGSYHASFIRSHSTGMLVDVVDTEKLECLGVLPGENLCRVDGVTLAGEFQVGKRTGGIIVDDPRNPSFALVCLDIWGDDVIGRANKVFLHRDVSNKVSQ